MRSWICVVAARLWLTRIVWAVGVIIGSWFGELSLVWCGLRYMMLPLFVAIGASSSSQKFSLNLQLFAASAL